jgi:ribosomal protein S16
VEILGSRNPRTKVNALNSERIKYWLEKGAQPSASVWNLFVEMKLIEGKKRSVTTISKKRAEKKAKKISAEKTETE